MAEKKKRKDEKKHLKKMRREEEKNQQQCNILEQQQQLALQELQHQQSAVDLGVQYDATLPSQLFSIEFDYGGGKEHSYSPLSRRWFAYTIKLRTLVCSLFFSSSGFVLNSVYRWQWLLEWIITISFISTSIDMCKILVILGLSDAFHEKLIINNNKDDFSSQQQISGTFYVICFIQTDALMLPHINFFLIFLFNFAWFRFYLWWYWRNPSQ